MTMPQVVLYAALAALAFVYARRWFLTRGVSQYSPAVVAERMRAANGIILLDVRTASERERQHIKGSLHIPLHELGQRMGELGKHRNKEVICYCQSGSRSISAAARLKKHGFTVANMKGGMAEWNYSGLL